MAVVTKRLAGGSAGGAGAQVIYTVPMGETTIVKEVRIYNASASTRTWSIGIRAAGLPDIYWGSGSLASGGFSGISQWTVLRPGDSIIINPSGATLTWWISGSELQGVAS